MKFLLFSDLHLDTQFQWTGPVLGRERRNSLRSTLQRIVTLAGELQVDALLCGGDLYEHDRFTPDTMSFVSSLFSTLDIPVYVAPGNHDWYGPTSLYQLARWSQNVVIFTESGLTPVSITDGLTLWGAAHRAPANTNGFLSRGFRVDRGGMNIALFHGSEVSAFGFQDRGKLPHAPFRAAEIEQAGLDHALLGHFHTPSDAPRHTYPGNPEPLSFGEEGLRGAVLITIGDDGSILRERHHVASSSVSSIDVSLDGVTNSSEIRDRVESAIEHLSGIVRVRISGEVPACVDVRLTDLKRLGSHLDGFVPQLGLIRTAYDFDELEAERTIRGQFVRDVRASSLDEDARSRVLVTGLRALDGRSNELDVR